MKKKTKKGKEKKRKFDIDSRAVTCIKEYNCVGPVSAFIC